MQQELFRPTVFKVEVAPGPGEERTDEIVTEILALVKEWGVLSGGNHHLNHFNREVQDSWNAANEAAKVLAKTFRNLGRV